MPSPPPPLQARIVEVADAVVGFLRSTCATPAVGAEGVTARRVWVEPVDAEKADGKQVFVFPVQYMQAVGGIRRKDVRDYPLAVVVCERVPKYVQVEVDRDVWVDAGVRWVEANVFVPLGNPRAGPPAGTLHLIPDAAIYPFSCEVVEVCDRDKLDLYRLFWSQVNVTFREE